MTRWLGKRVSSSFASEHILDALAGYPVIASKKPHRVADLGSGLGLPGIPLKIALPDSCFVLMERSLNKSRVLTSIVASLNLKQISVWPHSADQYTQERFDLVVLRAVSPLSKKFCALLGKLLSPDGWIAAYKGKKESALSEVSRVEEYLATHTLHPLSVPLQKKKERHLLLFQLREN